MFYLVVSCIRSGKHFSSCMDIMLTMVGILTHTRSHTWIKQKVSNWGVSRTARLWAKRPTLPRQHSPATCHKFFPSARVGSKRKNVDCQRLSHVEGSFFRSLWVAAFNCMSIFERSRKAFAPSHRSETPAWQIQGNQSTIESMKVTVMQPFYTPLSQKLQIDLAWHISTPCISTCPDDLVTAFATAPWRNA